MANDSPVNATDLGSVKAHPTPPCGYSQRVPDYDLYRLDDRSFEKLTVALSLAAIGPGVQAFGDGPDGGREATFTGRIRWSTLFPNDPDDWNGYCVIQAKYRVKKAVKPSTNLSWLQKEIAKELSTWKLDEKKRKRKQMPKYLIFVTNVELSSVAETGGIDKIATFVDAEIEPLKKHGLVGWKIWHADQLAALLDNHGSVRRAFPAFLTVGDVLDSLGDYFGEPTAGEIAERIRLSTQQSLASDRWVRFSESGASNSDKAVVESVAVDLPLVRSFPAIQVGTVQEEPRTAASFIVAHADSKMTPTYSESGPRHLLLIGGPGQGKTTISQLLAQRYRAALLDDETKTVVDPFVRSTTDQLTAKGVPLPRNRRWPFRVDLADYAETLGPSGESGLLRWIAKSITDRGVTDITPSQLRGWLQRWPWLLLLDGLDEIASPDSRANALARIEDLMVEADSADVDLVIVVTSRPMDYDDSLDPARFRHIALADLDSSRALDFSRHLAEVRFDDDPDLRNVVIERMADAGTNQLTARLMRTPLQLTIMSFIVEGSNRLPPDRYNLFDTYFKTIYAREAGKPGALGALLIRHRSHVEFVHEEVALRLHSLAERSGTADAVLSRDSLESIVRERLAAMRFEDADTMTGQILEATLRRLVLLVPIRDGVGFEVRSFQEFMAARAMTLGPDIEVLDRLRLTAHSPHWRNTWLFTAGAVFSARQHLVRSLIELFDVLDSGLDRLGAVIPSAPELALDVLDDGLAAAYPVWVHQITDVAMRIVNLPPTIDAARVAQTLVRLSKDEPARSQIFGYLTTSVAGPPTSRVASAILLEHMDALAGGSGSVGNQIRLVENRSHLTDQERDAANVWSAIQGWQALEIDYQRPNMKSIRLRGDLARSMEKLGADDGGTVTDLLKPVIDHLGDLMYVEGPDGYKLPGMPNVLPHDAVTKVTRNEEAAMTLQMIIQSVDPDDWAVRVMINASLIAPIRRRTVGEDVMTSRRRSVEGI